MEHWADGGETSLENTLLLCDLCRARHKLHTNAVQLLQAGVDRSVIALWLGHEQIETTQMYLHADLSIKEKALEKTAPVPIKMGRYQPNDSLLTFLEEL